MKGDALLSALSEMNESRCRPPLDEEEARQIAESAERYRPLSVK